MRKVFTIFTLSFIAITMYYLRTVENQTHLHIVSLLKYHYVVESLKDSIHIPIFISHKDSAITHLDKIDRIQIKNATTSLDLKLIDITWSHQETYIDITYHMFNYHLEVPRLNQSLYMQEAMIELTMQDGIKHVFFIGALEVMMHEDTYESSWTDMYAKRHQDRLSVESMYVVSSKPLILMISDAISSSMSVDNDTYRIELRDHSLLYWDIPVSIYDQEKHEMIIGMHWISSKRILSQTEGYHVTYDLYRNESRQTL